MSIILPRIPRATAAARIPTLCGDLGVRRGAARSGTRKFFSPLFSPFRRNPALRPARKSLGAASTITYRGAVSIGPPVPELRSSAFTRPCRASLYDGPEKLRDSENVDNPTSDTAGDRSGTDPDTLRRSRRSPGRGA